MEKGGKRAESSGIEQSKQAGKQAGVTSNDEEAAELRSVYLCLDGRVRHIR